jgi:hypothetical protein
MSVIAEYVPILLVLALCSSIAGCAKCGSSNYGFYGPTTACHDSTPPPSSPGMIYSESESAGATEYSCSIVGGGSTCFTPTTQYVAQAFTISSASSICSIGIGLFLGKPDMPMTNMIVYSDAGGAPGMALSSTAALSRSFVDSNEASSGAADQHGTVGSFCQTSSGLNLDAGTYWAVAYWSSIPADPSDALLNVWGYIAPSKSGLPTKSSSDGTTWVNAGLADRTQTLQLWINAQ